MERESEPDKAVHRGTEAAAAAAAQADRLNPASSSAHSKRLKELQNAALQTTLMAARMEAANLSCDEEEEQREEAGSLSERHAGEGERSNGLSSFRSPASAPRGGGGCEDPLPPPNNEEEEEKTDSNVRKEASEQQEEQRTLTDHLNKRLLSSFLEKLNERDLLQQALPGVQRLDCAVAAGEEEDSNRAAADDW